MCGRTAVISVSVRKPGRCNAGFKVSKFRHGAEITGNLETFETLKPRSWSYCLGACGAWFTG